MGAADRNTVTKDDLRQAVAFMRSGLWLLRVLDPTRPAPRPLLEWRTRIVEANGCADPVAAARMARPRSLLAQRLAEHVAVVFHPLEDADALAFKTQIVDGAPLGPCLMELVRAAGLVPELGMHQLSMAALANLDREAGGRKAAHARLIGLFEACATQVDEAITEAGIREERMKRAA